MLQARKKHRRNQAHNPPAELAGSLVKPWAVASVDPIGATPVGQSGKRGASFEVTVEQHLLDWVISIQ
jgi:hypothetical protein